MNKLLSNIRFSLSLRIALRYALFLLRTTISVVVIFTLVFVGTLIPKYGEQIGAIEQSYNENTAIPETELVSVRILAPDGTVVHDGLSREEFQAVDLSGDKFIDIVDRKIYLKFNLKKENNSSSESSTGFASFDYIINSGDYFRQYLFLAATVVVLDLLRVLSLLAHRRRLAKSVLKPIDEIAQAARSLSASNLDMRINILGTKNELRDLASVINEMLDRIETAYESQKAFVSDASHELRTPISVIRGYAQLLERWGMSDPEVAKEAIGAISAEAESMRELVEKLLFLARHDKKTFKLEPETFDLAELCQEMVRDTELIAKDHTVEQGPMQNVAVVADRSAVKQAIRVFIDNALKYTPKGGTITLSCEDMGDTARISVSDTGPGMTREEAQRAFDRFYRSDSARRSQVTGHGLGLSIARLIAASHGGKISVKTAPGEGSTFRLILNK